ncbi:MAG: helix-turn-helix domain-containing protein, partial [Microbacteriaceae bacterium]
PRGPEAAGAAPADTGLHLRLLGRDRAVVETATGATLELSPRHSEIMLLLAAHPAGLRGPELSAQLYRDDGNTVTLRAELARLRAALATLDGSIRLIPQPYRLSVPITTDAADVLRAVDRGAHRQALRDYRGAPLPASDAPGVERIRERTSSTLREAVLDHGNVDAVMALIDLPGHADDLEANLLALKLLPPRSPKRAAIVARLDALGA